MVVGGISQRFRVVAVTTSTGRDPAFLMENMKDAQISPVLPPELERIIFELAARIHRKDIPRP